MVKHNERCKKCKDTIYLFLSMIERKVEQEHDLGLPAHLNSYKNTSCFASLELIYGRLAGYRGYESFVRTDKLPKVDFYLPSYRMIVEFDESQHFTQPRFISLGQYPSDLKLGYDRQKWMELAQRLDKKDNDPKYRDEQRAWYDTLRDFSSMLLDIQPTVRLYAGDRQWCALDINDTKDIAFLRKMILQSRA